MLKSKSEGITVLRSLMAPGRVSLMYLQAEQIAAITRVLFFHERFIAQLDIAPSPAEVAAYNVCREIADALERELGEGCPDLGRW